MKKVLFSLLVLMALPISSAHALMFDFSTVSVVGDTGTYSIIFRHTSQPAFFGLITSGDTLDLMGIGERFDGQYFITGVTHSLDGGSFTSSFTVERTGSGELTLLRPNLDFLYFPTSGGNETFARIEFTPVPEPATLALLGIGLAGMGLARRRKKV